MPPATIDRFEVLGTLGQGGMGVVYEVRDPALGRRLALKLIRESTAGRQALERFLREAEVLARVQHPNVVPVFALGRSPQGPFIVQALLEGESLKAVAERGPLEPREAARIVRDLAGGLSAVHAQGVLHRDLKPGNVILTPEGRPVLLDFGLARDARADTLTQSGQVLGTPALMAPEQADGERPTEIDVRVDVYGLGAILYVLLTGQKPFSGPMYAVLLKVLQEDPPWPRALRPEVPAALDAICQRAMAKAPTARFATAEALREALEVFLADETPAAPRRRRGRAALGALVALGLGLGLSAFATRDEPAQSAPAPSSPAPSSPEVAPPAPRPTQVSTTDVPAWFRGARPHPPRLPAGVGFGDEAGEYRNLADGSRLVWVAPGRYLIGTPPRPVQLAQGFFFGKYEVSWAQFRDYCRELGLPQRKGIAVNHGKGRARPDDTHPVINVTWHDAVGYCEWAGLRLPTEVEWEVAGRGPQAVPFPWGHEPPKGRHTNLLFTGDNFPVTSPCGEFPLDRSWCGAFDMGGNVAEWVQDVWSEEHALPADGSAWDGSGDARCWRGGSYKSTRVRRPPLHKRARYPPGERMPWLGFRVARSLD